MLVEGFLEASACRFPEKTALVSGGARLSYGEVDRRANRLARALRCAGVERGDRVAVCLDNSAEAVVAIFGVLKAGGVFIVVNPTTKADKLAFILEDSRASALVTDGPKLASVADRLAGLARLRAIVTTGGGGPAGPGGARVALDLDAVTADARVPANRPGHANIDADLAALIYTSGSTGTPKGVMVTHLNVVTAATSITTYLENTPDDVILSALPLAFDYGLYQALMAFRMGATLVLERSFTYPAAVLSRVAEERVTGLPLVPTMAAILLRMDLSKFDLSSLRYITNTAAALPTRHIEELIRLFPRARLYSMYGLTECKRVSYLPPAALASRPTSVGVAIPNTEVYVVDGEGRRVGPGVVGELVVRGSHVMRGYWERPEETAAVLREGPLPGERVLYTGDLFRTDEEGFLYFVGRKDDIIKTRGEKVSPKEVENVLYALDGIVEAAIVGVPDPILGHALKAVVSLAPGVQLTPQEIMRHCRERLEDFMVPRSVEFRASLPKTATGKISRRALTSGDEAAEAGREPLTEAGA